MKLKCKLFTMLILSLIILLTAVLTSTPSFTPLKISSPGSYSLLAPHAGKIQVRVFPGLVNFNYTAPHQPVLLSVDSDYNCSLQQITGRGQFSVRNGVIIDVHFQNPVSTGHFLVVKKGICSVLVYAENEHHYIVVPSIQTLAPGGQVTVYYTDLNSQTELFTVNITQNILQH